MITHDFKITSIDLYKINEDGSKEKLMTFDPSELETSLNLVYEFHKKDIEDEVIRKMRQLNTKEELQ